MPDMPPENRTEFAPIPPGEIQNLPGMAIPAPKGGKNAAEVEATIEALAATKHLKNHHRAHVQAVRTLALMLDNNANSRRPSGVAMLANAYIDALDKLPFPEDEAERTEVQDLINAIMENPVGPSAAS